MKKRRGSSKLILLPRSSDESFNENPIRFGGVELRHRRVVFTAPVRDVDVEGALTFAGLVEDSAPYWIGDLMGYTDSRADWREKADQIKSVTGLADQTIQNYTHIARKVAPREREISPSASHAAVVAKMSVEDQRTWLKKAATEGWDKREFGLEVKAHQKRGTITGQAEIAGMHRVWLVDYPWTYNQAEPSKVSAQTHYPGMTLAEGIKMGPVVQAHTTKNAVLFFWVTAPQLYYATEPDKGPDPYRIMLAWGFTPKTGGVWDKVEHNFGNYLSIRHEHLLIGTRGQRMTPDRPVPMFDSIFTERRSDTHSEKPELVHKMIERLYDGPYGELFARKNRRGWSCYGNQIGEAPKAQAS